jgi:hypothetical protein
VYIIIRGRGLFLEPFNVFICHKKSSGKDYAEHLKAGLDELGYHAFLDSKDLPKLVDGREEWIDERNQALKESPIFILIITPGFDRSQEVKNEIKLAREQNDKHFIYFRHRDLGRKILVNLEDEVVDLGRQEQVSFETKEELLRLAHGILLKNQALNQSVKQNPNVQKASVIIETQPVAVSHPKANLSCAACQKFITGNPHTELIDGTLYNFDSVECAKTYRRLKCVYGQCFEDLQK